jgi:hypothetical protein
VWVIVFIVVMLVVGVVVFVVMTQNQSRTPADMVVPSQESQNVVVAPTGVPVMGPYSGKGVLVTPPSGWILDESGAFGTLVTFSNPVVDADGGNKLTASVNVVTEETKQTDLTQYLAASKEALAKQFETYTVLSEKPVEMASQTGIILESSYEMGVYKLHNMQLLQMISGKAYVVTATALESVWSNYATMFQGVLESFKVQ